LHKQGIDPCFFYLRNSNACYNTGYNSKKTDRKKEKKMTSLLDLFKPVEFSELNQVVAQLAGKKLNENEVASTLAIIQRWKTTTLKRLDDKYYMYRNILHFFESDTIVSFLTDEVATFLAEESDTQEIYEKWCRAEEDWIKLRDNPPQKNVTALMTTQYQKLMFNKDFKLAQTIQSKRVKQAEYDLLQIKNSWYKLLKQTPIYQEMCKRIKNFIHHTNQRNQQIEQLAKMASINVSVPTEELRLTIQQLLRQAEVA
jgi:hypothetical protein